MDDIDVVIAKVVTAFGGGDAAKELIFRTGLAESGYRTRRQYGGGPARGFWQMEPATERDIWENYLAYRPEISRLVNDLAGAAGRDLEGNDAYACAMCRVHYMRVPAALPAAGDMEGQAAYWKKHYNTDLGAGTAEHFLEAARERV